MRRRHDACREGRGIEAVVGDGREIGIKALLEEVVRALATDHAQQVLRRRERGIRRQRQLAFRGPQEGGEEHRQRAAHEIVVRHQFGVGQHAEPDTQPFDGRQALGGLQQLRHFAKGPNPRQGEAFANGALVATTPLIAGGKPVPQQRRHPFEAARGDEFLDGMAAHDQPAGLAVDLAHHRVGHDQPVEAAVHPCLQHRKSLRLFAKDSGRTYVLSILIELINNKRWRLNG